MNRTSILELLPDYARGKLDDSEAKRISALLDADPQLRDEYDKVRRYYAALASLEPVEVPQDFLESVHQRIQNGSVLARALRKLLVPLHIKLPIEALGLVAVGLLVFAIFNPLATRTGSVLKEKVAVSTPEPIVHMQEPPEALAPADLARSAEPQKPMPSIPPSRAAKAAPEPKKDQISKAKSSSAAKENRGTGIGAGAQVGSAAVDDKAEIERFAPQPPTTIASSSADAPKRESAPAPRELRWTLRPMGEAPLASAPSAVHSAKRSERKAKMAQAEEKAADQSYSQKMPESSDNFGWIEQVATSHGATQILRTDESTPERLVYRIRIPAEKLGMLQAALRERGDLDLSTDTTSVLREAEEIVVVLVINTSR